MKEEIEQKVQQVSNKIEIQEKLIWKFLRYVSLNKNFTSRDLIRLTGLPQTNLYRLLTEFTDYLEPKSSIVAINKVYRDKVLQLADSKLVEINAKYIDSIRQLLKKIEKLRPSPDRNLDQFTATKKTTIKRVLLLAKNGDLEGKSIAFLGDDDLVSIAVALTGKCKKVTVFEIDNRLNDLITTISKEYGLKIDIVSADLLKPIDKKYYDNFDLVFTDPPYTKEGINIFLNQAINLIRKDFLGKIYICYGNSDRAREREIEIQRLFLEHNLLIRSKYYQFSSYYGAESIGSRSSLYILDWTPSSRTVKSDYKRVYTYE